MKIAFTGYTAEIEIDGITRSTGFFYPVDNAAVIAWFSRWVTAATTCRRVEVDTVVGTSI